MKKKLFLTVLISFLLIYCFSLVAPLFRKRKEGTFSNKKLATQIQTPFTNQGLEKVQGLFSGPFHYMGHGLQSIAFTNDKQDFVLKFFLKKSVHGKKIIPAITPLHLFKSYRKIKHAEHKKRKLQKTRAIHNVLKSYATVYEKCPDIAALIAIHPNAENGQLPTIELIDQNQISHRVDLNQCAFVIQKKATLLPALFTNASKEKQQQLALKLESFLIEKATKGFFDKEKCLQLHMNYGFVDDQFIQLDIGKLEFSSLQEQNPEKELLKIQKQLQEWLKGSALL